MSGTGRGVRLEDGEETIIVRASMPKSLVAKMDTHIEAVRAVRKIDRAKFIREAISATLSRADHQHRETGVYPTDPGQ